MDDYCRLFLVFDLSGFVEAMLLPRGYIAGFGLGASRQGIVGLVNERSDRWCVEIIELPGANRPDKGCDRDRSE